ncbi:MAG: aminopeptidase P family protein [Chloroflexi bacterium]|nr:aminopeptidase P family protein [Chloroflexota bacterium]
MDRERVRRLQSIMAKDGVDVLLCRLPENVLYATGYWPVIGASLAIVPANGDATLIMPYSELDYATAGWVTDQRTFRFITMQALANPTAQTQALLRDLWAEKNYGNATVGYEGNFELVAGNNVAAEARVVTEATIHALKQALPQTRFVDATNVIKHSRIVKSQTEIAQIRITNQVASMGYDAAREMIAAGVREAEIAGAVEGRIYGRGVGYKNVTRSRGYCFVMSGVNSVNSWRPFCVSTDKRLAWGEPVLVELDAMTNGYFNDLTRTFFVGTPDAKAKSIFDAVQEAVNTVIAAVKPGVRCADLDAIARRVIDRAGFGEYFNHQLGHGVGLQFHEPPTLHPASTDVLEEGMVFAIEPAIYIPGFGGVRLEDNLAVTKTGCENLCPFPQRVD